MVPTEAGKRILDGADLVLCEIDNLRDDITRMSSGESGTLRVSACRSASFHWLPQVLKDFKGIYPGVEVSIDTAPTHNPIDKLLSNLIDIAVVNFKEEKNGVAYLKLFDDQMVVVVRHDHPWASKDHISARSFSDVDLITYDLPFEVTEFNKLVLAPADIVPKSLTKVPSTDAIVELIKAGMGVAVLNLWSAAPHLESGELAATNLKKNGFNRSWYAAITEDPRKPPYIAHFIGFLAKSQN